MKNGKGGSSKKPAISNTISEIKEKSPKPIDPIDNDSRQKVITIFFKKMSTLLDLRITLSD